jgi:Trypsin-like peptidase domain
MSRRSDLLSPDLATAGEIEPLIEAEIPLLPTFKVQPADTPIAQFALRLTVELPHQNPEPVGTAVWICGHLVLTARHNIEHILRKHGAGAAREEGREVQAYSIRLYQVFAGRKYAIWEVRQAWLSRESDLALLNVVLWQSSHPESLDPAVGLLMRGLPPPVGSKVAGFGHHSQTANITFGEGDDYHLEMNGVPQTTTGVVEDVFEVARDSGLYNFPCFQVNARFDPGMSGGPVFDEAGRLVGIISGSLTRWRNRLCDKLYRHYLAYAAHTYLRDKGGAPFSGNSLPRDRLSSLGYSRFQI